VGHRIRRIAGIPPPSSVTREAPPELFALWGAAVGGGGVGKGEDLAGVEQVGAVEGW